MPNSTLPRGSAKGTSGGKSGAGKGVTSFNGQIGDVFFDGSSIPPGIITYGQIQDETAHTLLGNPTGSAVSPSEIVLGTGLSFSGDTLNASATSGVTSLNTETGDITLVAGPNITIAGSGSDITITGGAGSGGSVTSVSVASANGFAGTVSNPTTTPNITLSTSISGILKGNGTAIQKAVGDTDYQNPITLTTTGSSGAATFTGDTLNIPEYAAAGSGVTSFTGDGTVLSNSASTGAVTATLDAQSINKVLAGPITGSPAAPTFRALAQADLPSGTGTVVSFSAGALSPLFTTSVANATSDPALTFSADTVSANEFYGGPASGASADPTFRKINPADLPIDMIYNYTYIGGL